MRQPGCEPVTGRRNAIADLRHAVSRPQSATLSPKEAATNYAQDFEGNSPRRSRMIASSRDLRSFGRTDSWLEIASKMP
jgi:hypothetical protein